MTNADKLHEIVLQMDDRTGRLFAFFLIGYLSDQINDSVVGYAEALLVEVEL
jgi:hypothetical protein